MWRTRCLAEDTPQSQCDIHVSHSRHEAHDVRQQEEVPRGGVRQRQLERRVAHAGKQGSGTCHIAGSTERSGEREESQPGDRVEQGCWLHPVLGGTRRRCFRHAGASTLSLLAVPARASPSPPTLPSIRDCEVRRRGRDAVVSQAGYAALHTAATAACACHASTQTKARTTMERGLRAGIQTRMAAVLLTALCMGGFVLGQAMRPSPSSSAPRAPSVRSVTGRLAPLTPPAQPVSRAAQPLNMAKPPKAARSHQPPAHPKPPHPKKSAPVPPLPASS